MLVTNTRQKEDRVDSPEFKQAWLVIPLYNEATVIGDVVQKALGTFPNIVCVDDGSTDSCGEIARKSGAWLVTHPINLGQGAALQTGIEFALTQTNCEYIVTFDADGQHSVTDAAAMVTRLEREPLDIVVGSRFLMDTSNVSPIKRIVLKMAISFERWRTGLKLTDAHNGLRALNRNAASQINITQNRMAHASEITSRISELNLRYSEQPVTITYTDYSKGKGQSIWNSVNILSELWMK